MLIPTLIAAAACQDFSDEILISVTLTEQVEPCFADLDADGDLDLLALDVDRHVIWIENNGTGGFGEIHDVWDGGSQRPVAVDVDGDGDLDIAALGPVQGAVPAANQLRWIANDGQGQFGTPSALTPPIQQLAHCAIEETVDLDGDGDMDFITAFPGLVHTLENVGGGAMWPVQAVIVFAGDPVVETAASDLDGDGIIDAVWMLQGGNIQAATGLVGVNFGPHFDVTSFGPPFSVSSEALAVGDVDADGDTDLVATIRLNGQQQVKLLENDGSGVFTERTWSTASVLARPLPVLLDFDADGDLDVFASLPFGVTAVLENRGPGMTLGAPVTSPLPPPQRFLGAADLDGSGRSNVWASGSAAVQSPLLANGSFGAPIVMAGGSGPVGGLVPLDWDGDGALDLFAALDDPQGVATLILTPTEGPNLFARPGPSLLGRPFANPPVLLDVDRDGLEDVLVAEGSVFAFTSAVRWSRNLGEGFGFAPFTQLSQLALSYTTSGVVVGDGDGDGDLDVFISAREGFNSSPGVAMWTFLDAAGSPTDGPRVDLGGQFAGAYQYPLVGTLDANADGLDDVVYRLPPGVAWLETLPGGNLGSSANFIATGFRNLASTADVDGDGIRDVLVSGVNPREVQLLRGLAGGGFAPVQTLFTAGSAVTAMTAADVNADGFADIAILNGTNGSAVLPGTPSGGFGPAVLSSGSTLLPTSVIAFDIDHDTDLDLVVSTNSGATLRLNGLFFGSGRCVTTAPNSTGKRARMYARGSASVAANGLVLGTTGLPAQQFGIFVTAAEAASVPIAVGTGTLCLGGVLGRFSRPNEIRHSGAQGAVELDVDLNQLPAASSLGPVTAGDTRYFQYWTRDVAPVGAALSTGLAVRFEL